MSPSRPRRSRASSSSPKANTPRPESAAGIDLRALISAAGDVILVADYDGRFVRVSSTDTALLYRPAAELIGRTVHDVFPQPQADAFLGIIRRALETRQPVNYEYDLPVGGSERWFAATVIPMPQDRVLWVARDITERRQMENISEDQRIILELIASRSPFQQILETLARSAETRLPGAMCSIAILDAESQRLRFALALSLPEEFAGGLDGMPIGPRAGSCGTAAFRGETVIVSDIKHDELWTDYRKAALAHGLRACWSKPAFSSAGDVLGTIAFYFREPRSPGPYELRLIDTTAHLASIIIQRHKAEEAERERVSALQAVHAVGLSLTANLDLKSVLETILRAAHKFAKTASDTHIFTYDTQSGGRLHFGAAMSSDGRSQEPIASPRPNGLTFTVAREGRTIVVPDMHQHPLFVGAPREWSGGIIGLPLKIGQRVVGVMNVAFPARRTVPESELQMLTLLADQAAIAIENARLFQAERDAHQQAEALREVATALNSSLDREQVLQSILEQLSRVVEYDSASVMLASQEMLIMVAHRGFRSETQTQLGVLKIDALQHIREAIEQRHPVIIADTHSDPRWQPTVDPAGRYIRCWLGVPLVAKDTVVGVLNLDKEEAGFYTERHASLTAVFANQAAIAIENARLYGALALETQRLELLNQLGRDLSARLDPEQVYAAIHRAAEQLMICDAFAIVLVADSGNEIEPAYLVERGVRSRLKNMPIHRGLSGQVIATGKPVRIDRAEQMAEYDVIHFGSEQHVRSALAVPMRLGGKVIGVLTAQSYEEHTYTPAEEQILLTFGSQAAIAIENARLYAEVQRQLTDQTLLYECGQRLALAHDMTSVYAIVAERVTLRFGGTSLVYYSYLEMTNECRVEYEYWTPGATEGERRSALGYTAELSLFPNTMAALSTRTPQVTNLSDPGITPEERRSLESFGGVSVIAAPMILRDRIVGFLELWNSQIEFDCTEQDKRLLLALATQAAIALENAKLYAETKRQSFELSTLLEAATAISSTLNVDDVINLIAQQIVNALDVLGCTISKWDREADSVITWADHRQRRIDLTDKRGASYPLDQYPLTAEVLRARQMRIITLDDPLTDPAETTLLRRDAAHSLLMLPLAVGDRVIGLLEVLNDSPARRFSAEEINLAQGMANQAALAIVNAQLFDDLAQEKARLELLYELSQSLANMLDPAEVAGRALERICSVFGAFMGAMFVTEPGSDRLRMIALTNSTPERIAELDEQIGLKVGMGSAGWVAEHREARIVGDVSADPHWFSVAGLDDHVQSVVSAPLVAGNNLVGVFNLYSDRPRAFRPDQLPLLAAATAPVAAALHNAGLFDETRRYAREATIASNILHWLNAAPDAATSFQPIGASIKEIAACESVSLALLDESRTQVIIAALDQPRAILNEGTRIPVTMTAAAEDVLAGRVHITFDLAAETEFSAEKTLYGAGYRSRINLPLRVGDGVVGALNLLWRTTGGYARINMPLMKQIADALALAIENARFAEETQRRDAILESLALGSQRLLMPGDLNTKLLDTLSRLGQVIEVSRVYVFENHRVADGSLVASQKYEWCRPGIDPQIDNPELQDMPYSGVLARYEPPLSAGQPVYGIVREFPVNERAMLEPQSIRSLAIMPIFCGDEWWGFLGFDDCVQERIWALAEIEMLKSAASMIGALFARERSEAAEREQRALAEALRDTASTINATLDFDVVLDRLLDSVGRVVPHEAASIMLIGTDKNEAHVVRSRGYRERAPDFPLFDYSVPLNDAPNLASMLANGQPMIIGDVLKYPGWIDFPPARWVRSYLGAPVRIRGHVLGFINLDSDVPDFFRSVHAERLQAFADQAAVAIENANLYEASRQSAEELAILYRASAQLFSLRADTPTLAMQIAEVIVKDFGTTHCSVLAFDETERVYRIISHAGDFPISNVPATRSVDGPGLIAAAIREGDVIYAPDVRADSRYLLGSAATLSEMVVPLKSGERVIGALNLESQEVDAFNARTRRMLVAFAERASLALENTQLLSRLDSARRAAEDASQLKSEFLANTSHELRTPLTGIIGSLSMVLDGMCDEPEEEREFIQIAYTASEHLLSIINNVLDIAKIEAGRMEIEAKAVDLAILFSELRLLVRMQADEKNLYLRMDPPADSNLRVWADPDKLRQILINLIGNAIKFTETGGVTVETSAQGGWVGIEVRDTGIGIPLDKQGKLFQPFVQADGSMTRKYGGTGLGLSISRRLAEMMGGSLSLHSAGAGLGSTLTLRLPRYENGQPQPLTNDMIEGTPAS